MMFSRKISFIRYQERIPWIFVKVNKKWIDVRCCLEKGSCNTMTRSTPLKRCAAEYSIRGCNFNQRLRINVFQPRWERITYQIIPPTVGHATEEAISGIYMSSNEWQDRERLSAEPPSHSHQLRKRWGKIIIFIWRGEKKKLLIFWAGWSRCDRIGLRARGSRCACLIYSPWTSK